MAREKSDLEKRVCRQSLQRRTSIAMVFGVEGSFSSGEVGVSVVHGQLDSPLCKAYIILATSSPILAEQSVLGSPQTTFPHVLQ